MPPATRSPSPRGEPLSVLDRYREAGLGDRVANELQRRLKQRKRRRTAAVRTVAGAALLLAFLAWAGPYFKETGSVSVPVAAQEVIALPDGSRAELNANTTLRTDFRYGRRLVTLQRGEGFFSIAPDPSRPFFVATPAGTVRVLGTKFNVRLDAQGRPEVTLVEGQVLFAPDRAEAGAATRLNVDDQLTVAPDSVSVRRLDATAVERVLAWRRGQIVLDGLSLSQAATAFARYHGCGIAVDPAVAGLRLGGTYSLKNLPMFLDSLTATGAVKVTLHNGAYRLDAH